jgi:hypothetical protein
LAKENLITIEYTLALVPPNIDDEKKTEDWVCTIASFQSKQFVIVFYSYI